MFPALPNGQVVLESILRTAHIHSLVFHIVTTRIFDLGHQLDFLEQHHYQKHILATMAGLLQSKWADPPAPAATEDKKQPETEQAPKPEESVPAQPIEIPESRRKSEHTLSAAATAFPGLAALARTFSLGGRSPRPRSLETATAVPSPATLSSFAQQQSAPPTRTTMVDPENSSATEVSGSGSPGNRNPDTDRGKAAKDNPPFDFQKLLDQMKLKGAEPVAKYLRSYVCVTTFVCLVIDCIGYMRAS